MSRQVLVRPLLTEKLTMLQEKANQYAFEVLKEANKIEIKNAVETRYKVTVETVNTSFKSGKKKQQMTKRGVLVGKRPDVKKAIVKLKTGDVIDFLQEA